MKKVFDLHKVIPKMNEDAPLILLQIAMEFEFTGTSQIMAYQGKTEEEVGIMVGPEYQEKNDDSMDYAFVDESDFVSLTNEEAQALVLRVMADEIAKVRQQQVDNFLRNELGLD